VPTPFQFPVGVRPARPYLLCCQIDLVFHR